MIAPAGHPAPQEVSPDGSRTPCACARHGQRGDRPSHGPRHGRADGRGAVRTPATPFPRGHTRRGRLMPTHQSIGGATDEQLLQRMVATHSERFGEDFWQFFTAHVASHLPSSPTIVDLGCGPALFLRDIGERYPAAALYGYDVTPAMVAHGRTLACTGAKPTVALLDATTEALPHAAGSANLVSMSSVLHVIDEPLPVLAEIRRVLRPGGIFLLNDWIRQPLSDYLAW